MPTRCSSQKIKAQMAKIGMKASKLAVVSGLSESTIHRLLTDKEYKTCDKTLQLLSDALKCSPFDLLRDEEIAQVVKDEAHSAVVNVVAEAVSVVTESLVPDAKSAAEQLTDIPVTAPAALDIPTYIEYIKETHVERVAALQDALCEVKKARNQWRWTAFVLAVLLLVAIVYFTWEIYNPGQGITKLLWSTYHDAIHMP